MESNGNHTLADALRALADADPDRAQYENSIGFNKPDSWYGHTLSNIPESKWTSEQRWTAWQMLRKYARQLSEYHGINFDAIPVPPRPETEDAKTVARETLYNGKTRVVAEASITEVDGGYHVSFPYNAELLADLKSSVDGRRWIADGKKWFVPTSSVAQLAAWAERNGIDHDLAVSGPVEPPPPPRRVEVNGEHAYIYFPYDPNLVEDVKMLPSARWDPDNKRWYVLLSASANQLRPWGEPRGFVFIDRRKVTVAAKAMEQRLEASGALDAALSVENLGGELKPFQRAGVKYALAA